MPSAPHSAKQVRIDDPWLKIYKPRVVVWWYGPVERNTRANSVPLVRVLFQCPDKTGEHDRWLPRSVALPHIGLLRVGSVWRKGICVDDGKRRGETFDLDFSDGGWSCVSPSSAIARDLVSQLDSTEHPFPSRYDLGYLLNFKLPGGRNLLVPCMEFFARCYGRSAEIKRVLTTYRWEDAEGRLYLPLGEPAPPDTWAVKLSKRMRNDDVVFLAHVKYDEYARRAAKLVYSQAETAPLHGGRDVPDVFLRATPWFQGPAKLEVSGIAFNGGRSFLALRILGASQPRGLAVLRDRENRGGLPDTDKDGDRRDGSGPAIKRLRTLPDILDLTGDEEPDRGSMSIDIEEDDFRVLGEPRTVIDRKSAIERGLIRRIASGDGIKAVSTGEAHGSGKGVGYGSIHAPVVLESQGALRETWKAARRLAETHHQIIHSVGWFTFEAGVSDDDEPKLIALSPDRDEASKVKSTWVYHDVATKTPRGVLVIAMEVDGATVYLLEIQRRTTTHVDGEESEESFRGLAVAVRDGQNPRRWLPALLGGIQAEKGILQRLTGQCPGRTYAYKHVPYKNVESVRDSGALYETAVVNALAKVGYPVTVRARRRKAAKGAS